MSVFPNFIKKYGGPIDAVSVPAEVIDRYKDKLPESIIQFWQQEGWGGFIDGLIWIINPDSVIDYIPQWMDYGGHGIPFMRTAFGDIVLWVPYVHKNRIEIIFIRYQDYNVIGDDLTHLFEKSFCNEEVLAHKLNSDNFQAALQKLGPLKPDECYGYEPALALGGEENINNLKIVKYIEHLDILTQLLEKNVD